MTADLERLFDGIIATLNDAVMPNLSDSFARGQLLATIYALSELKLRTDWSSVWLLAHRALQEATIRSINGIAKEARLELPARPTLIDDNGEDATRLQNERDAADAYICLLQSWRVEIVAPRHPHAAQNLAEVFVAFLRGQVALEESLTPNPMFAKVSRGG